MNAAPTAAVPPPQQRSERPNARSERPSARPAMEESNPIDSLPER